MATGPAEDEEMPDEMAVALVVVDEEEDARGVDHAARDQPEQRAEWDSHRQRTNRHQDEPSHPEIEADCEPRPVIWTFSGLQDDAKDRERPNERENAPAPR